MAFSEVVTGEVAGSVTAAQLPDIDCEFVKIKAHANNAASVYIGPAGVTVANGTTDATTGLELAPGDDSGWLPIDDLSKLYIIGTNATDDITYLAVR